MEACRINFPREVLIGRKKREVELPTDQDFRPRLSISLRLRYSDVMISMTRTIAFLLILELSTGKLKQI